jgi:hypothetical protein
MILKDNTVNIIDGDSFGEVFESKINAEKLSKAFGILSSLYKDIPGSIVREYVSNQIDSHISANKQDIPAIVNLHVEGNDSFISFQDFGVGMSPDLMKDVYFNYLNSTKENTNRFNGCWGLGSKSALAYTHTMFIDTIYDSILYHYIFSKQANGIPAGELLYTEVTDKCNGTTIKIPIKPGDEILFRSAIQRQVVYFPNVYVESNVYGFDNDYKIYEFDDFLLRSNTGIRDLHIALGNVYYPIDWQELKINPIPLPLALKFEIGELTPTPSRESIVYSLESIKLIEDKIKSVCDFLDKKYNEQVVEVNTLKEYEPYYNKKHTDIKLSDDLSLRLTVELLNNKKYFSGAKTAILKGSTKYLDGDTLYELRYFGYKVADYEYSDSSGLRKNYSGDLSHYSWNGQTMEKFSKSDLKYAGYDRYPLMARSSSYLIISKDEKTRGSYENLFIYENTSWNGRLLEEFPVNLKMFKEIVLNKLDIPKEEWRSSINTIMSMAKKYVTDKYGRYSDVVVDEQWIKDKKDEVKAASIKYSSTKTVEDVKVDILERDYSHGYIWKTKYYKPDDIKSIARRIIWVEMSDRNHAKDLHTILNTMYGGGKFAVIAIAKNNVNKYLSGNPSVVKLEDFIVSKSKASRNIAMVYYYYENLRSGWVDKCKSETMLRISPELYSKAKLLHDYSKKYNIGYMSSSIGRKIMTNMFKIGNVDKYLVKSIDEFAALSSRLNKAFSKIHFSSYNVENPYHILPYVKALEYANIPVNNSFRFNDFNNPLMNSKNGF